MLQILQNSMVVRLLNATKTVCKQKKKCKFDLNFDSNTKTLNTTDLLFFSLDYIYGIMFKYIHVYYNKNVTYIH
jgi:hypothetical protein